MADKPQRRARLALRMTILSIIAQIQHRFDKRLSEWNLAIAMTAIGIILLLQPQTFSLAPYAVIKMLFAEEVWGIICLTVGVLRLAVLVVNGSLKRGSPHLRAAFSFISIFIWSMLLAGYLGSHLPSLMIAMTGAAIFTEFITVYRTAGQSGREDDRVRNGHNTR